MIRQNPTKKAKYFMLTILFFYKDLIFLILDIYKCPFLILYTLYEKIKVQHIKKHILEHHANNLHF